MKILEYIFYRMYKKYKAKGDPEIFSSSGFMITLLIFLTLPISGFIADLFRSGKNYWFFNIALYGCFSLIFIIVYFKFTRNIKSIVLAFQNSKWNKKIPFWLIFMSLPFSMVFGVIANFYGTKKIILALNLEGFIFRTLNL